MNKIDFEYIHKYNEMRSELLSWVKKYLVHVYGDIDMTIDSWVIGDNFLCIDWYNEDEDSDEATSVPTKEFFEFIEKGLSEIDDKE